MTRVRGCIRVIAGVNGAGKSTVLGAMVRDAGDDYFNPDEYTQSLRAALHGLSEGEANAAAWKKGYDTLLKAVAEDQNFAFETTLGGHKITAALQDAIAKGMEVRVGYVGLVTVDLHVARVKARVSAGGHDIPEAKIRARYQSSRQNLIILLPGLKELTVFDNSSEGDPRQGQAPSPMTVLHMRDRQVIIPSSPAAYAATPAWAQSIVAAATPS